VSFLSRKAAPKLHTEWKACGAKIIEALEWTVYKCYEMVVEGNFGFHPCFSVDMASPCEVR
jgi:hypothetical protein